MLIQPRLVDRALFFVTDGRLEVASISKSGESLGILNRISERLRNATARL